MSDARKPTYDQLSALCAQMAAALEASKKEWRSVRDRLAQAGICMGDGNPAIAAIGDVDRALTAYRSLSPDAQWQDISTAPKNNRAILLGAMANAEDAMVTVGWWDEDKGAWYFGPYKRLITQPTMWMPLPDLSPLKRARGEG